MPQVNLIFLHGGGLPSVAENTKEQKSTKKKKKTLSQLLCIGEIFFFSSVFDCYK